MTTALLIGLLQFAFVSSITPGPNNLMLLASGANFGFRRTIPHMLGVGLGHSFMIVVVGLGLIGLFEAIPWLQTALTAVGIGYLLWLAWKIAHAAAPGEGDAAGRPLTFLQAALFQWVNPKGWFMALGAISLYTASASPSEVLIVALVFMATNIPSISLWAWMGTTIRRWLDRPSRLRAFNWTMAGLLVLSLVPVLRH